MGIDEKGIVVKQSRISYFYNYLLIGLVVVLFVLSWFQFNLTFKLFPPWTFEALWKTLVVFGFIIVMVGLFEEPTIQRWFRYYVITNNEVILTDGILRKNRVIIPYQNLSNIDVYKGITGRIFNFGDVTVVGFRNKIVMRGIREPEVFYRIINNKISMMRGTKKIVAREKIKTPKRKIKRAKGWREREKALKKELKKKGKKKKKKRRLSLRQRRKQEAETETETEEESEE